MLEYQEGCKSVLLLHLHLEFCSVFEVMRRPRSSIPGETKETIQRSAGDFETMIEGSGEG